ncbi:MAG TPA: S1C family serine protease [Bryobacteraceae bacterium]|nr:S1C family serine protease [Bryobacteraceae bacterium]
MSNPLVSFSDQLAATVARAGQSVVAVHGRSRFDSSGLHWSPGIIVTADHALRRDEDIRITAPDGSRLNAELVGRDPGTDLAVLRAEGLTASVADEAGKTPAPGSVILAVGRFKDSASAAFGVLSSISGPSQTWRGGRLDQVLRVDVALHPAASGGAIVDAEGELVGIATPVLSRVAVFAIPPATVQRVVDTLLAHGRIPRGYLGVGLQPVAIPEHLKSTLKLPGARGLIVISVDPDAPAGQAGITLGDVLIELSGTTIQRPEDVQQVLDSGSVGKQVSARLLRGGKLVDVEVTVGERPRKG